VTGPGAAPAAGAAAPPPDEAKLRGAARQLTGVFAQQLFKAMRATVPQDEGVVSGGSGEEMFTGMLDEHLAGTDPHAGAAGGAAGAAFTRGLADAVYRRLRAHAGAPAAAAPAVTPDAPPASLVQSAPLPRR
jgi:flagellar protein FlgJ